MATFQCPKCSMQIGNVESATCGAHGPMQATAATAAAPVSGRWETRP